MAPIDKQIIEPLAALSLTIVAFLVYHFFGSSSESKGSVTTMLKNKGLGVLVYGVVPVIVFILFFSAPASSIGVTLKSEIRAVPWIGGLSVLAIALASISGKNEKGLEIYPQIRESDWTWSFVAITALSWIIYLTAYEFLFRGFLLFSWYRVFGFWPAVIVNIAIYTLVHVPKGIAESIGSIVAGIMFCVLTLMSGTILIALCVHVALALSNEFWSLAYHPDMRLSAQRKR